jgi:hypothetical protein
MQRLKFNRTFLLLSVWVSFFAGLISILYFGYGYYGQWMRARYDVHAYWDAALRLRSGAPLYASSAVAVQAKAYLYPPSFAGCFAFFTLFPKEVGFALWAWAQLFGLGAILYFSRLLLQKFCERRLKFTEQILFLSLLLWLIIGPLLRNTQEGQVNCLLIAVIIAAAFFYLERRLLLAAACLAFASHLKLVPLVLIAVLALRGDRKFLRYSLMFLSLFSLLPFAYLPWGSSSLADSLWYVLSMYVDYWNYVLHPAFFDRTIAGSEQFFAPNFSTPAMMARLFAFDTQLFPFANTPRGPLLFALPTWVCSSAPLLLCAIVLGTSVVRGRKALRVTLETEGNSSGLGEVSYSLECALLAYFTVVFSMTTCWEHRLVSLVLPFIVLFSGVLMRRYSFSSYLLVYLWFVITLTIPMLNYLLAELASVPVPQYVVALRLHSLPTLGLLAISVLWLFEHVPESQVIGDLVSSD